MPWFRLDDSFHSHPKVIAAGNEAVGLYVRCGTYAAEHLTDGFLPKDVVLLYGSGALAEKLTGVKLWHRARGGWTIHDYLDYNPSKQAVDKDRLKAAERQRRHRSGTEPRHNGDTALDQLLTNENAVDNSGNPTGGKRTTTSQGIPSRRDNGVTNGVSHTTPTRPDPYIDGSAVTQGAGQARARDPDTRYRSADTAAARHPSARSAVEAALDAGIQPGQRPADERTIASFAAQARQAITRESA